MWTAVFFFMFFKNCFCVILPVCLASSYFFIRCARDFENCLCLINPFFTFFQTWRSITGSNVNWGNLIFPFNLFYRNLVYSKIVWNVIHFFWIQGWRVFTLRYITWNLPLKPFWDYVSSLKLRYNFANFVLYFYVVMQNIGSHINSRDIDACQNIKSIKLEQFHVEITHNMSAIKCLDFANLASVV